MSDTKRCRDKNGEGEPCGALAWRDGLCRWHHPDLAAERAAWREKGGRASSNVARARKALRDEAPGDLTEVEAMLREAMPGVLAGTVAARQALALAALARAVAALREPMNLEQRLDAIEEVLKGRTA
jgi:hypothetical protein